MKVKDVIQEINNIEKHKRLLNELMEDFKENDGKRYDKYFTTLNLAHNKLMQEKQKLLDKRLEQKEGF